MMTGSTRGKCSALQAGHSRFCPPRLISVAWPQTEQKPWRLCQLICARPLGHDAGLGAAEQVLGGGTGFLKAVAVQPLDGGCRRFIFGQVDGKPGRAVPQPQQQGRRGGNVGFQVGPGQPTQGRLAAARGRPVGRLLDQHPRPRMGRKRLDGLAACSAIHCSSRRSTSPRSKGLPANTC